MMDELQIPFSHHFQNENFCFRRQGILTDGDAVAIKMMNSVRAVDEPLQNAIVIPVMHGYDDFGF